MLKVALTGGAGSGKSTVARMFKELGAAVVDADAAARDAVRPGAPAWEELRRAFGPEFFQEDGELDRGKMARLAFSDPEARQKLNAILHPRIIGMIRDKVKELSEKGEKLVIVEVPLLFETGLQNAYDRIIVVYADTAQQMQRLKARDERDLREIDGILAAQWPLGEKRRLAHYVIDNRGSLEDTKKQVENIWRDLKFS
ncbi:MAG: dephospho-CoA kinase [Deltaproteobacteria bacterium]|nr:dephospho-CoA kinase [Deltaproteobacteria bacterium]